MSGRKSKKAPLPVDEVAVHAGTWLVVDATWSAALAEAAANAAARERRMSRQGPEGAGGPTEAGVDRLAPGCASEPRRDATGPEMRSSNASYLGFVIYPKAVRRHGQHRLVVLRFASCDTLSKSHSRNLAQAAGSRDGWNPARQNCSSVLVVFPEHVPGVMTMSPSGSSSSRRVGNCGMPKSALGYAIKEPRGPSTLLMR